MVAKSDTSKSTATLRSENLILLISLKVLKPQQKCGPSQSETENPLQVIALGLPNMFSG
jgi:hypothetical protein